MTPPASQPLVLKILITVVATAAIVFKAVYPAWDVDAVTLGLFVIAILPWLAPLIKSVELPGGLKVELQDIKEAVEKTKGTAESARQRAEFAVIQAEATSTRPIEPVPAAAPAPVRQEVAAALVADYNRVRAELPSGQPRTQRMTEIVTKMIDAAHRDPAWNVREFLAHADRGWRLMAYAFAYARPDFALFNPLVASACTFTDDNQPFGQYWSILAIERVLGVRGKAPVSRPDAEQLEAFYRWLTPGTDRSEEMRRVMAMVRGGKQP
ncbi:hypothetical protein [Horticoccus sp. 23ND18S-11]|uniref:hypothetical protein n=1 Tax=Horticoccus sp. 23ND18S-11 TaxID=3391832 RepID=UPI0039C9B27F